MCLLICLSLGGSHTNRFPALLGGIIHPTSRMFLLLLPFTIMAPAVLKLHTGARKASLSSHVPSYIHSAFFLFNELLSRSSFLSHSLFYFFFFHFYFILFYNTVLVLPYIDMTLFPYVNINDPTPVSPSSLL